MTTVAWVILVIFGVPALALLAWVVVSASLVRVPTGSMGLVLVRGRPSDTVLHPGVHLVPALRRRMLELYPAVELAYRPGVPGAATGELEQTGPALEVWLGDRTAVRVACTLRFRLRPAELRGVHERYGTSGVFGPVRDEAAGTLTRRLADPAVGLDDLVEPRFDECEKALTGALQAALTPLGFEVTFFSLGPLDLGRAGELVQQVSRARHELAAEEAGAALRLARAAHDRELRGTTDGDEASWRYREADDWRELAGRPGGLQLALRVADPPAAVLRRIDPASADPAPSPAATSAVPTDIAQEAERP